MIIDAYLARYLRIPGMTSFILVAAIAVLSWRPNAFAPQPEHIFPVYPADTGKALGMQVRPLSTHVEIRAYAVIFRTGDEVVPGMTDFAKRYTVGNGRYQGIGNAGSVRIGWYDKAQNVQRNPLA